MSEISYSKIVFGLKHHQQLYDCRKVIELIRSLRIIISEHDAVTDACDRPGLHYHGIIEHRKDMLSNDRNTVVLLRAYCTYCKIDKCDNPEQTILELAQPPRKIMIIEIANSTNLKTYYSTILIAGIRLETSGYEIEVSKMETIKFIIAKIQTRRTFEIVEIWKEINGYNITTPDELLTLVTYSVDLVRKKMIDRSILDLCGRFIGTPDNYYSVQESTDIVVDWCRYQSIDIEEFTTNWIKCLDRQVSYRNSLYFQGSSESGAINIINSIADACAFVGQVDYETTGFAYVWEDCLERRCIIMRDPIFDECMFEELENIFRGVGTTVPHRQSVLKYLRPTPAIVICSDGHKNNNLIQRLRTHFIEIYTNLKPYEKLTSDDRRLHPDWLNVLFMNITEHKIDNNVNCCEHTWEKSMDCDFKFELAGEGDVIGPDEFLSSIPFDGCSSISYCSQES